MLGSAELEDSRIARIVAALAGGLDSSKYRVHALFFGSPGPLADELHASGATARSVYWPRRIRDPAGAYRFWQCLGIMILRLCINTVAHAQFAA